MAWRGFKGFWAVCGNFKSFGMEQIALAIIAPVTSSMEVLCSLRCDLESAPLYQICHWVQELRFMKKVFTCWCGVHRTLGFFRVVLWNLNGVVKLHWLLFKTSVLEDAEGMSTASLLVAFCMLVKFGMLERQWRTTPEISLEIFYKSLPFYSWELQFYLMIWF